MMIVLARNLPDVQVDPRVHAEGSEKLPYAFGGKISDHFPLERNVKHQNPPAGDIERDKYKRFVHYGVVAAVTDNPLVSVKCP